MLAHCQPTGSMRPYSWLACTLAPDSTDNPTQPRHLAADELNPTNAHFWALTENAALFFRTGQPQSTVLFAERSLAADGRTGRAVVNWLWLALAYQKLGDPDEARRCLGKASSWLDQQGDRMPSESPTCTRTLAGRVLRPTRVSRFSRQRSAVSPSWRYF